MRYHQPYGVQDVDAPYINGDPSLGRQGSIIPAEAVEYPQREIVAAIEAAKLTPDDASLAQLLYAMRSQRMNYALAVNSAPNAVAVEFDPPIANTMTPGMPLRIKGAVNNTGATTLVVDGDSHALRYASGAELLADDIKAGVIFEAIWNDAGYWEFNPYASGAAGGGSTTNTFVNIPYVNDTGTPNSLVANFVPAITALVAGTTIEVRLANDITGASQIKVNALAPVPIVRGNGAPLQSGDAATGQIMLLIYSAAQGAFQFFGLIPKPASGLGPVGSIILTAGNAAFPGTLKLNGAILPRTAHPQLYAFAAASGRIAADSDWTNPANRYWTSFSYGDGSTTFRLPDFRGEFMRFWDDARGVDPGRQLYQQQNSQTGEIVGAGSMAVSNIIWDPSKAPPSAMFTNPNVSGLAHALDSGPPMGDFPKAFTAGVSLNLNVGQETRPRNAPVVPLIVDG